MDHQQAWSELAGPTAAPPLNVPGVTLTSLFACEAGEKRQYPSRFGVL